MKRIKLSDGIYLNIIESDKFKTDYFDINIILPLREETASYAALLPMVIKRGCEKYPTMAEITKRLDYLYSTGFSTRVMKRGEMQIVGFGVDFLREILLPAGETLFDDVFDTVKNIVFKPLVNGGAFKDEYVQTEKKNLIDAINALINNKNAYAMKKCHQAMCKGENFAVSENGSIENVEKICGKDLYEFYKNLMSSARMEFFYTGKCDEKKLIESVKKLICDIERNYTLKASTQQFVRKRNDVEEIVEEMEVAQGKLIMAFSSGTTISDEDYTSYLVFNNLFGGSPTSKLFENVREKMSLCYYCRSLPESHKGILTVASGIEVENYEKAKNEIVLQLENVKRGIISDEELVNAKKALTNSYRELFDDAPNLSFWYLSRLIGGSEKTVEDVIDEIAKVTKEQIAKCAIGTELDTVFFLKGTLNDGGDKN
ncbi:MAG: insulinase family protein [Ruminococcaceae bacterium]|nr:insulinase family protein [Oscillospiraceae bacterium]